jgi:hypothetical protein
MADSEEGNLHLTCPDFTSDLAMRIVYADSLGVTARGIMAPDRIAVYPNPCHDILHIRIPARTRSVRLLTLTGQVVEERSVPSSNLVQVDLSRYRKGVYLVQVIDRNGLSVSSRITKL